MDAIICGIDPGLRITGYAVLGMEGALRDVGARGGEGACSANTGDPHEDSQSNLAAGAAWGLPACRILDAGVCRFDEKKPLELRLVQIEQDINAILDDHAPDVVAVEQLYAHYKHPRTAILMGHARGVMLLAAARREIPVRHFAATEVKRFLTGNGRASKLQVQRSMQATLGLATLPEPEDMADALAIALCCAAAEKNR